jgi:hypothetical protein
MNEQWSLVARTALREALSAWNDGHAETMGAFLTHDVVFSSPFVETEDGKLVGREIVVDWIIKRRQQASRRELVAILMGAETVTVLMKDAVGFVSWQLRATENFLVKEIIDSHSVMPDASDDGRG